MMSDCYHIRLKGESFPLLCVLYRAESYIPHSKKLQYSVVDIGVAASDEVEIVGFWEGNLINGICTGVVSDLVLFL